MINYNGSLLSEDSVSISIHNRAFKYGDAIFETIKVLNEKVIFCEDHYFRLMASSRMIRMEVPMHFTLEFFENEILTLVKGNDLKNARVRFSMFRKEGGLYTPANNEIDYLIEANDLTATEKHAYEVELYKDHYVYSGVLSTLKSNNRLINTVASIFKKENGYDNCLLLNEKSSW